MINRQEIFNTVVRHLHAQGKPCIVKGICRYRGPDNTRCAIGALILDEFYTPEMEGKGVTMDSVWQALQKSLNDSLTGERAFFVGLQTVHDNWPNSNFRPLPYRLKNFAEQYNLDTKILEIFS